ncbi:hypothetical protein RUM43_013569 [Polyplax serrata]|uniref:Uncharacterized protein n=1 Tax=Polyplax serrata TaxID=468196 RepID=A0AAN8P5R4_POLSC
MEGDNQKTIKYLMNQPATVHNYGKLSRSDSPRSHSSPTSILRKFPHSLRHDQKHQTKIKRNSSPVSVIISGIAVSKDKWETNRKSYSLGDGISDESEERPSSDNSEKFHEDLEETRAKRKLSDTSISSECSNDSGVWKPQSTIKNTKNYQSVHEEKPETRGSKMKVTVDSSSSEHLSDSKEERKIGHIRKLSVINNSLIDCKNLGVRGNCVNKVSELGKRIQFPVHKSTPNLLRSSVSHPADRSSVESEAFREKPKHKHNPNRTLLRGSDSLPHLDQKYRIINSILPKLNRTISESPEGLSNLRKTNLAKACIKSESHINSQNLYNTAIRHREPYFSLSNIFDVGGKADVERSDDDENEEHNLIDDHKGIIIRSPTDEKELKTRWSYKRPVDLMPNLKNLMSRRSRGDNSSERVGSTGPSAPLVDSAFGRSDSFSSLNIPQIRYYDVDDENMSVKKCETVYALTSLIRSESQFRVEPIKPVNRLRVLPNGFSGSTSRMCSRCSSLLSMASSSRYSINTTGSGFVNCSPSVEKLSEPNILCKLCLMEVPVSMSLKIHCCGCVFCKDVSTIFVTCIYTLTTESVGKLTFSKLY